MKSPLALVGIIVLTTSSADPAGLAQEQSILTNHLTPAKRPISSEQYHALTLREDDSMEGCDIGEIYSRSEAIRTKISSYMGECKAHYGHSSAEVERRGAKEDWIKYSDELEQLSKDIRDCAGAAPGLGSRGAAAAAVGSFISLVVWCYC